MATVATLSLAGPLRLATSIYSPSATANLRPIASVVGSDGGLFVYSYKLDGGALSGFLTRFAPSGVRSWSRTIIQSQYSDRRTNVMRLVQLLPTTDGGAILIHPLRATGANTGSSDYAIRKFSSSGDLTATKRVFPLIQKEWGNSPQFQGCSATSFGKGQVSVLFSVTDEYGLNGKVSLWVNSFDLATTALVERGSTFGDLAADGEFRSKQLFPAGVTGVGGEAQEVTDVFQLFQFDTKGSVESLYINSQTVSSSFPGKERSYGPPIHDVEAATDRNTYRELVELTSTATSVIYIKRDYFDPTRLHLAWAAPGKKTGVGGFLSKGFAEDSENAIRAFRGENYAWLHGNTVEFHVLNGKYVKQEAFLPGLSSDWGIKRTASSSDRGALFIPGGTGLNPSGARMNLGGDFVYQIEGNVSAVTNQFTLPAGRSNVWTVGVRNDGKLVVDLYQEPRRLIGIVAPTHPVGPGETGYAKLIFATTDKLDYTVIVRFPVGFVKSYAVVTVPGGETSAMVPFTVKLGALGRFPISVRTNDDDLAVTHTADVTISQPE